jgi:hypothetical protein
VNLEFLDIGNGSKPPPNFPRTRPHSARLVASVSWSWGPAHGRTDIYHLSTDRHHLQWILWCRSPELKGEIEPGKVENAVAYCERGKVSAKEAASLLVQFAWQKELAGCGFPDGSPHYVDAEGLLSEADVRSLSAVVWI